MQQRIGIFGGTFDPIHNGHLRLAIELQEVLSLAQMHLVPCFMPAYRDAPRASAEQRLQMASLAIAGIDGLQVDARELARDTFTYSIDSVREFREQTGETTSLCFCIGADSFHNLASWREWQSLTDYVHLIVAARPGAPVAPNGENLPEPVQAFYREYRGEIADTFTASRGKIVVVPSRLLEISATDIRARLQQHLSVRGLVPDQVEALLLREKLYQ